MSTKAVLRIGVDRLRVKAQCFSNAVGKCIGKRRRYRVRDEPVLVTERSLQDVPAGWKALNEHGFIDAQPSVALWVHVHFAVAVCNGPAWGVPPEATEGTPMMNPGLHCTFCGKLD